MHVVGQICLVALGSAIGGLLRWGIGLGFGRLLGPAFPWGTFFINISGSLFLGWFSTVLAERHLANGLGWLRADDLKLLVAVGFTGAYTTFSTFELESHDLLHDGAGLKGTLYMLSSVVVGLLAVRLGVLLARAE